MAKNIPVVFFVLLVVLFGGFGGSIPADDKKPTPAEIQEKLKKLRQERLETLREELDARKQLFRIGRVNIDSALLECSKQLANAELAVAEKLDDRIAARKAHLDRMVDYEKLWKGLFDAGRVTILDYSPLKAARLQAEIHLLEEQAKAEKKK